ANLLDVATVVRTSGFVEGNLMKPVALGSPTLVYELGSGSDYTPVDLAFFGVTTAGKVSVVTVAGDHPAIATSGLDAAQTANRLWRVTNSGSVFGTYKTTLRFVPSDLDAGADPSQFAARRYS